MAMAGNDVICMVKIVFYDVAFVLSTSVNLVPQLADI